MNLPILKITRFRRFIFLAVCAASWGQATNKMTVTLGFVGDLMLGRLVNDTIVREGSNFVWGDMQKDLQQADYLIGNLETDLTKSTTMMPKVFNFKADPVAVKSLQDGHVALVNLANNHSRDFADEGLFETLAVLDRAQIRHVGAGIDKAHAQQPIFFTKNGIRFAVIGLTDNEPTWQAGDNNAGTDYVRIGVLPDDLRARIRALKRKVDRVIVTIHWGPNMRIYPSQNFINFAHTLIEAGVDIIHGHSAHVVQGIEVYKGGLIMYDTGDFIDDYVVDSELRNDLSFLFNVTLSMQGVEKVSLIPVKISGMQVNHATGADYDFLISVMKERCGRMGTHVQEVNHRLDIVV